jgi:hypothetical protein
MNKPLIKSACLAGFVPVRAMVYCGAWERTIQMEAMIE